MQREELGGEEDRKEPDGRTEVSPGDRRQTDGGGQPERKSVETRAHERPKIIGIPEASVIGLATLLVIVFLQFSAFVIGSVNSQSDGVDNLKALMAETRYEVKRLAAEIETFKCQANRNAKLDFLKDCALYKGSVSADNACMTPDGPPLRYVPYFEATNCNE